MAGHSELAVVLVLLMGAMGPAEAHPRVMLNTKASLLALKSRDTHGQIVGTGKILREMSEAERAVAAAMKGHPKEMSRVEGLLHAASRMERRAGVSESKAKQARQDFALLEEEETALVGSAAVEASRAETSAKAEEEERSAQLHTYAAGLAEVAAADRSILSATNMAEEEVAQLRKGRAVSKEVSRLLDVARLEERRVLASEKGEAEKTRRQAALLDAARDAGAVSSSAAGGVQRELEAAEREAASLLRKRPRTLRRVRGLLRAAARMARHASAARSLQRRSRTRFALLAEKERALEASSGASSAAEEGHHDALLRYAAGMAQVSRVDRQILAATKRVEDRVRRALQGAGPAAAEVSRLLGAARREEGRAVAMEAREAGEARSEARELEQQRQLQQPGVVAVIPAAALAEDAGAALMDYAADISEVSRADQRIMFETDKAREEVEGVLRSGGAGGALARTVAEALDEAEAAEKKIVASEGRQVKEARKEIEHLQGQAPAKQQHDAAAQHAALTTGSSVTSRRLEERLQKVRVMLTEEVRLAARQAELSERSQELAARLSATSGEVLASLRADGDAVDRELAAGELNRRLAEAQRMLQDVATAHRLMAVEAEHKASALIDHGRSLAVAGRQQRLLEKQGAQQLLQREAELRHTSRVAAAR